MSTTCPADATARWYEASPAEAPLSRFLGDFVSDEVSRLRPGGAGRLPPLPWEADLAIDDDGIGLDSLERLSVATALSEALHLHESGLEDLLLVHRRFGEWVELAGRSLAEFDRRLTFRTSGSSGVPKPCEHRLVDLEAEADHWADLLAGTRRVLCAVPSHHIYGFIFSHLLPRRLAGVETLDIRKRTLAGLPGDLGPGDVVIGHPAFWTLLARHADALTPGVVGVTSTAPCPDDVANRLASAGLSRLIQIYGSSETAGIGWRGSAAEPYRLLPHWERVAPNPLAQVPLTSVAGATGEVADDGDDGSAHVRRRTPETAAPQPEAEHALPDRVAWLDDARFRVLGRRDAAVQVAGINVFPERVRAVLLSHPAVADAAVRPMAPHEGDRLKAFIVLHDGAAPDDASIAEALTDWMRTRLTAPERPRSFRTGPALPRNALGKLSDWAASDTSAGAERLAG